MASRPIRLQDATFGEVPLMRIIRGGRWPQTCREWARWTWNMDLFVGRVPLLKTWLAIDVLLHLVW